MRHVTASLLIGIAPLVLVGLVAERAYGQEGGIDVFAGQTLFEKGTRVSGSYIYKRKGHLQRGSDKVSDPQDRLFEEHRFVAGLDHGILPNLTASLLIPFVYRERRTRTGAGSEYLRASGLGDVAFLAKYRFYKLDWERSAFDISLVGGLEVPSGDTDEKKNGVRLPPEVQVGAGAWNPFLAGAAALNLDRFRLGGLVFYKFNTEGAQDFEFGDFLALEVDATYRFLHTRYPGPTGNARLGIQWRHEAKSQEDGRSVLDSGSDELLLRAGLTFHPVPSMDLTLSAEVPVYQDYRGEQLALDVRTFFALGIRF